MTELALGSNWMPDPFEIAGCKRAVRRQLELVVAVTLAAVIAVAITAVAVTGIPWTRGTDTPPVVRSSVELPWGHLAQRSFDVTFVQGGASYSFHAATESGQGSITDP